MTLLELIKQVKELDKKATPGPWVAHKSGRYVSQHIDTKVEQMVPSTVQDNRLIAHYRTAAPTLAKACEVLEEALSYITVSTMTRLDGKWGYECADIAKKALAEVERILCQE